MALRPVPARRTEYVTVMVFSPPRMRCRDCVNFMKRMNRFSSGPFQQNQHRPSRLLLGLLLLSLLLPAAAAAFQSEERADARRGKQALYVALERDISTCYALEGFYPPDLDYLKEHYGLTYDENSFVVEYQPVAGNIRPDVTILEGGTR